MGKKGKKDVEKKLALAARKEAKQEKSARKRLTKQGIEVSDEPEDELDRVLQAYKSQDKAVAAIETGRSTLEPLETPFPLPRANATMCDADGEKRDYLYLFGGEYFDGVSNVVLDDLLRYEAPKKEWKRILTSPRPNPRCAHSCVSYKQSLYVFGGELATSDEYHHYRDLWKFDVNSLKWTEISTKNPPSARSGHVCVVWKNFMILFGGFFEALRETKFYSDVHVFNLQTETWMEVPQSRLAAKPEPRSACNAAIFGADKIMIHGGFSKMKTTNAASETKVHTDAWVLHLSPLLQQKPPTWERWMSSNKSISSHTPNGRAGTTSISYKTRLLVFGGVVDHEHHHHKVESVFYNDLMAMDMERRKWFPLRVESKQTSGTGGRRRRKPKDENDQEDDGQPGDNANDDEEESDYELEEEEDSDGGDESKKGWDLDMLRANMFAFVDGDGNIVYEKIEEEEGREEPADGGAVIEEEKEEEGSDDDEEDEEEKEEDEKETDQIGLSPSRLKAPSKTITSSLVMVVNPETNVPEAVERTAPLPRINTSIVVRGHTMYLFGGILEVGDREVTLDDMWALDLRKRDAWDCLWRGTMHTQVWRGAVFDDDDSYISTGKEDGSDFDDDDFSYDDFDNEAGEAEGPKKSSKMSKRAGLQQETAELNEKHKLDDEDRTPDAGESLADFYSRTSKYWNGHAAEALSGIEEELSNKELKRQGFKLAKDRYDELEPILAKLAKMEIKSEPTDKRESKKEKKKEKSKKSSKR